MDPLTSRIDGRSQQPDDRSSFGPQIHPLLRRGQVQDSSFVKCRDPETKTNDSRDHARVNGLYDQVDDHPDIFTFANHLAWRVGGPITIEDPSWSIIAYSTLHHHIDDARRHTILRHAVPSEFQQLVSSYRVGERFIAGENFVEIPADPEIAFDRRIAVPVRIHDVVVGSIWVADPQGELDDDAVALLIEASQQATHYFRIQSDHRRRESDIFLNMMLSTDTDSDFLAQYFGLMDACEFCVLRVDHANEAESRQQVLRLATVGCGQSSFNYLPLHQTDCTYLVFYGTPDNLDLSDLVKKLAYTLIAIEDGVSACSGRVTGAVGDIHRSRTEADLTSRYVRATQEARVAHYADALNGITLMEIVDLLAPKTFAFPPLVAPLDKLQETDRAEALELLEVYFEVHGRASEASRLLHMHANTFRYRLGRIQDLLGIDLDDHETRLLLELQMLVRKFG